MKKILSIFIVTIFLFNIFIPFVSAKYTTDELSNNINENLNDLNNTLELLANWSKKYGNHIIENISPSDMDSILDYLSEEDYIGLANNIKVNINSTKARTSLTLIAHEIEPLLKQARINFDESIEYIKNNKEKVECEQLFFELYIAVNKLKLSFNKILDIYINNYKDEINNKINTYVNLDAITLNSKFNVIDEAIDNHDIYFEEIEKRYIEFENLYYEYKLDDLQSNNTILNNNDESKKYVDKLHEKILNDFNNYEIDYNNNKYEDLNTYNQSVSMDVKNIVNIKKIINKLDRKKSIIRIEKLNTFYTNKFKYLLEKANEAINYGNSKLIDKKSYIKSTSSNIEIKDNIIVTNIFDLDLFEKHIEVFNGNIDIDNTYMINRKIVIGTGTILKFTTSDNNIKEYKIIVKGDVNQNGIIDVGDITKIVANVKNNQLTNFELTSADLNNNSKIDIGDIIILIRMMKEG